MSTTIKPNATNGWFWCGLIVLICLFLFKWLPDWTWTADRPVISVNNYIFETRPIKQGETTVIESSSNPTIHIRITPKKAISDRAHLIVTLDGKQVDNNCPSSTTTFCYVIPSSNNYDGREYSVVAKNDAGEAYVNIRVVVKSDQPSTSEITPAPEAIPTPEPTSQSTPQPNPQPTPQPMPTTTTCYHEEQGICLDDYEDEAYSAAIYDHEYGYYGASLDYPDNCNTICREYLEDAYEEGWYDSY